MPAPAVSLLPSLCCCYHWCQSRDIAIVSECPAPQRCLVNTKSVNKWPSHLHYSCLENPMDRGTWWAAVHGVARSRTWPNDFSFTFHFHALEKEMATHSSVLAWRIPETGEPGGLPSMGSHRVGHDWSDLAAAAAATRPTSVLTELICLCQLSLSKSFQRYLLSTFRVCLIVTDWRHDCWFSLILITMTLDSSGDILLPSCYLLNWKLTRI